MLFSVENTYYLMKTWIYLDVQFVKRKNPVMNFLPVTLCHLRSFSQEFQLWPLGCDGHLD